MPDLASITFGIACFLLVGLVGVIAWLASAVVEIKGMLAILLTKIEILWDEREPSNNAPLGRKRRNTEP